MRIEWDPPLQRTKARREERSEAPANGHFASALAGGTPVAAPATAANLSGVGSLLSVQEMPDALAGRRKAIQRGNALLDRLEDLRLGLLSGIISREQLDELARLSRTARAQVDDARLGHILDEVDLRVAVELAKLEAGPSHSQE